MIERLKKMVRNRFIDSILRGLAVAGAAILVKNDVIEVGEQEQFVVFAVAVGGWGLTELLSLFDKKTTMKTAEVHKMVANMKALEK